MFLESDNVSSSEASATRVDIMNGVRNFRPRQVRTVERGFCFYSKGSLADLLQMKANGARST